MKLNTSQAETSGNLVFKRKIAMRLDDSARALIIKSIIDMYSNPYVAAMREYTSNAIDSHVWAGESRPVELTLPTRLSPNLIIQDWGIGLSAAELEDYSQFGTSTKRDTNTQIGGFGFGSKSGLAVCSRFTVESVKNGLRSVVVIGRDADGPQMGMLVEDEECDAPNGLKVTIPTSENYKFTEAIDHNFFIGWEPGWITINGESSGLSVHDTTKFEELGGAGWLNIDTSPSHWSTHTPYEGRALVGPVSYKVDWSSAGIADAILKKVLSEIVLRLDNGEVDLTPSREALIYSARTRKHIQDRVNTVLALGQSKYAEQVEKAATLRDALILMFRAKQFGFGGKYVWGGKPIEMGVIPAEMSQARYTVSSTSPGGPSGFVSSRSVWMGFNILNNMHFLQTKALTENVSVIVEQCDKPERVGRSGDMHRLAMSQTTLARALASRDGKSPSDYTMMYTDYSVSDFPEVFRAGFTQTITSDDAKALIKDWRKRVHSGNGAGRTPVVKRDQDLVSVLSYFRRGGSGVKDVKIADLDKSKKYILLKNGDMGLEYKVRRVIMFKIGDEEFGTNLGPIITAIAHDPNYEYIFANKNWKTENYTKYLTFVSFEEAARAVFKKAASGLTGMQRRASADQYATNWASNLIGAVDSIRRPELREYVRAAADRTIAGRLNDLNNLRLAVYEGLMFEKAFTEELPDNPCFDYPLLAHVGYARDARAEIIEYVNLMDERAGRIAPQAQ